MSGSSGTKTDQESGASRAEKKFKGVRRRKWGKWVSEIRVPGKQERLWLGSYSTPEAAAVAHDIASYCFRGPSSIDTLNFPLMLPASVRDDMSPKSIQRAASDAGMAIDAQMILSRSPADHDDEVKIIGGSGSADHGLPHTETELWEPGSGGNWGGNINGVSRDQGEGLNISIEDYLS